MWCVSLKYPSFVGPGPRCQSSSRWWVTTSSEGVFHDDLAIDQTRYCFCLTNKILWNFSLTNQISLFLSSICRIWSSSLPSFLPSVENTDCRVTLVAFVTLHSPAEVNWMLLCGDIELPTGTWLLQSGRLWELLTHSDSNGQVFWITATKKCSFLY